MVLKIFFYLNSYFLITCQKQAWERIYITLKLSHLKKTTKLFL